jgi:hypothetical protein
VGATTLDPPALAAVPAWAAVDSAVVAEEAAAVVAEEDAGDKQMSIEKTTHTRNDV